MKIFQKSPYWSKLREISILVKILEMLILVKIFEKSWYQSKYLDFSHNWRKMSILAKVFEKSPF